MQKLQQKLLARPCLARLTQWTPKIPDLVPVAGLHGFGFWAGGGLPWAGGGLPWAGGGCLGRDIPCLQVGLRAMSLSDHCGHGQHTDSAIVKCRESVGRHSMSFQSYEFIMLEQWLLSHARVIAAEAMQRRVLLKEQVSLV